jgi:hypothetical protein
MVLLICSMWSCENNFRPWSFDVQIRCSVLFDFQSLSAFGHSVFGHSVLGPYSALGPIRPFVFRPFVIRPFVFRPLVIRPFVIRPFVFRPDVGESILTRMYVCFLIISLLILPFDHRIWRHFFGRTCLCFLHLNSLMQQILRHYISYCELLATIMNVAHKMWWMQPEAFILLLCV